MDPDLLEAEGGTLRSVDGMELFRLHAYTVSPARTAEKSYVPKGGAVAITSELREILEESTEAAKFERRTAVDFQMSGNQRHNEVRELLIKFAHESGSTAKSAATALAARLSEAMDRRSTPCLMIVSAGRDGERRSVTLWTFPRDRAFRLQGAGAQASIQVLTDIFSQTSKLRKAARFEGRRLKSEFLQGRVLDFQADTAAREVADFWIIRFLDCKLSIGDDSGTRMLAETIKKAVRACEDVDDQEQLVTAAMAVRRSPTRRWSLRTFADTYLADGALARFRAAAPKPESYDSLFNLVRTQFEQSLAFRVFTLTTGVLVSSPIKEIGRSVAVSDGPDRRLSCEGVIESEGMRATRG